MTSLQQNQQLMGGGNDTVDPLLGSWVGTWKSSATTAPKTDNFTIEVTDDVAKGQYKVVGMFLMYGASGTYYANFSDNVLTILSANSSNKNIGSMPADFPLAYSEGTLTNSEEGVQIGAYSTYCYGYSATKQ